MAGDGRTASRLGYDTDRCDVGRFDAVLVQCDVGGDMTECMTETRLACRSNLGGV